VGRYGPGGIKELHIAKERQLKIHSFKFLNLLFGIDKFFNL